MIVKSTLRLSLTLVVLFGVVTCFSSCSKDDSPNAQTLQLQKLSATWKVSQVTNDNQDVTNQYAGFILTVNELNYTTQNGGNPWPTSGAYTFKEGDLNTLLRSDDVTITIDEITESTLLLAFNFNTVTGGRLSGVTGDFTFSLIK